MNLPDGYSFDGVPVCHDGEDCQGNRSISYSQTVIKHSGTGPRGKLYGYGASADEAIYKATQLAHTDYDLWNKSDGERVRQLMREAIEKHRLYENNLLIVLDALVNKVFPE